MVVAEDSTTARHILVSILGDDPMIEVVGEAANGAEAIELTRRLRPGLVVMDIRMPVMDGFEATKRIMSEVPTPVVIVTAMGEHDVHLGLRAVQVGALTVLPKPGAPTGASHADEATRLVSMVKALAEVKVVRRRDGAGARGAPPTARLVNGSSASIVGIAASTGGPAALHRLIERLPRIESVPILVVQHIAEGFTPGLVAWLGSATALSVKMAQDGERLVGGTVYVAAEQRHLEVTADGRAALTTRPPVEGFCPSATVLFESMARHYGPRSIAVVLTGMGRDGLEGAIALRHAGGRVLAQDEASSVVFGMPGVVVAEGLAELVGPVDALADALGELTRRSS